MSGILRTHRLWVFAATLAVMLYGFMGMFGRAANAFRAPEEDMSFAWYVPLFSLYVLWTQKDRLIEAMKAPEARPSWLGFALCLPCLLLALLGARGLQLRFEQVAFIGLLIFIPWTFYGRRVASFFVFPALYLVFTIPVSAIMDMFTIHLRLFASGTALAVLNGCGVDAVREGTAVVARGAHPFSIDVAEPCSGLRSLFALMALTAAYAWYAQPTWTRRAVLFVTSVPIAIFGNVVRILTICGVAATASADFALGFYHDYSGYVVFIVAIALMLACSEIITRICGEDKKVESGEGEKVDHSSQPFNSSTFQPLPYVAAAVLSAAFVFQSLTPASMVMEAPEVSLPEMDGFTSEEVRYCQNEACSRLWRQSELASATNCPSCGAAVAEGSLGELTVLPSDTRFVKRLYRSASGQEYLVSAVIGGVSKRSLHRPELCLPGQGFTLLEPRDIDAGGRPFRALKLLPPHGGPPHLMVYTFFNQAGVRTASHTRRIFADTWDRTVHNRIDRWVMVTIHASSPLSPHGLDLSFPAEKRLVEAFLAKLSEVLP